VPRAAAPMIDLLRRVLVIHLKIRAEPQRTLM
jgi:hypothetical protein